MLILYFPVGVICQKTAVTFDRRTSSLLRRSSSNGSKRRNTMVNNTVVRVLFAYFFCIQVFLFYELFDFKGEDISDSTTVLAFLQDILSFLWK